MCGACHGNYRYQIERYRDRRTAIEIDEIYARPIIIKSETLNQYCNNVNDRIELTMQINTINALFIMLIKAIWLNIIEKIKNEEKLYRESTEGVFKVKSYPIRCLFDQIWAMLKWCR